jgi:hypothetical protein
MTPVLLSDVPTTIAQYHALGPSEESVSLPAEQVAAANGYGCHASCCAGDHASRSRG